MLLEPRSVIDLFQKQNSSDPLGAFPYFGELRSGAAALSGSTRQLNAASSGRSQLTPLLADPARSCKGAAFGAAHFIQLHRRTSRPVQQSISPTYGRALKAFLLVRETQNKGTYLFYTILLDAVVQLLNIVCRPAYRRRSIEYGREDERRSSTH